MNFLGMILLPVLAVLAGPVVVLAAHPPLPGAPVLVIALPWHDPDGIVALSGGARIGPEMSPMAVLAQPESPDFIARANAAGAIGVFDGQFLANWCRG